MTKERETQTLSFESDITPLEYIYLMFDRTDGDGVLYIPEFPNELSLCEEKYSYRCKMDWTMEDRNSVCSEFKRLYSDLKGIAEKYEELDGSEETAQKVFCEENGSARLFNVWQIFVKSLNSKDLKYDTVHDISDRLDTADYLKELSGKFTKGAELTKDEKDFFREYIDVSVTKDEKRLYNSYCKALIKEAEKRVGNNICAYEYVIRATRLCRLLSLNAPEIVIKNEARLLAAAMVLHKYCISKETVDNTYRLQIERYELMSDEELDNLFRPKKTNSRKSMAPLFVYLILKEHSSSEKHLRQQDILKILEGYPYEVPLERKALSRIIHNITDSQLSVFSDKTGTWLEQEEK